MTPGVPGQLHTFYRTGPGQARTLLSGLLLLFLCRRYDLVLYAQAPLVVEKPASTRSLCTTTDCKGPKGPLEAMVQTVSVLRLQQVPFA
jgi:hypothetical protein